MELLVAAVGTLVMLGWGFGLLFANAASMGDRIAANTRPRPSGRWGDDLIDLGDVDWSAFPDYRKDAA